MRTKKWAVALLAVALMLCLLPTAAFAAGNNLVWLNNGLRCTWEGMSR